MLNHFFNVTINSKKKNIVQKYTPEVGAVVVANQP